ncbi:hypothetical protein F4810DRAFT_712373 [Camillea tinctor]|nr:hypothetical protein F4810DRAFT_712373 [Camillea tinctor]
MAQPRNTTRSLPGGDISTIPPGVDPASSRHTTPRLLTAARVDAVLRRSKSFTGTGFNVDPRNENGGHTRLMPPSSPVRANSRRRRSVASAPDGSGSLRNADEQSGVSQSPESRGNTVSQKFRGLSKAPSAASGTGSRLSVETSSSKADNSESPYVAKGTFLLHKSRPRDEFQFPKAKSQPDPVWQPGDGFSGDEARPDFIFSMTSNRKRKRSGSLSGMGKLQIEAEKVDKNNSAGSPVPSRPRTENLIQRRAKYRSSGAKEIWPTLENFEDPSLSLTPKREEPGTQKKICQALSPSPSPILVPKLVSQHIPLRNRGPLDFENFGRPLQYWEKLPNEGLPNYSFKFNGKSNENDEDESVGYDSDVSVIPETDYSNESESEDEYSRHCSPMELDLYFDEPGGNDDLD